MRILLITAYFPPDIGSASHLFYELGQSFRAGGDEVRVVTGFPGYHPSGDLSRYRGRGWMVETMDGMEVTRVRAPQVARDTAVGRGLWQFSCAASFALAVLRGRPPDVALVYSPPLPLGLTALALRRLRGVPFVFNVQDLFPQSAIDLGLLRNGALIHIFQRLESLIYRRADAVTVHSEGNRSHVVSRGAAPDRTRVMHNSVDIEHIRPAPRSNTLRDEIGAGERFVVSFGGIMGHSQDLSVILEAARLVQGRSDMLFVLAGEGVQKESMMQRGRELGLTNVVWLPMLPRERYPSLLHASDACLTTLHADVKTPVVPSKILSTMAAGRPVVAALPLDGDAPRLIALAEAGCSVPPEDPAALAEALLCLASDPALCRRLGENGRRFAETHLSPAGVASEYRALFGTIASRRGVDARPAEPRPGPKETPWTH